MLYGMMLGLGSLGLALVILLYPAIPGGSRPWALRTSWALWCLQPALLLGAILVGYTILGALGYTSASDVPSDVDAWITLVMVAPVGLGLLAGTLLGGLAWRSARLEQPPTSRRWWALAATVANALWFLGGAWLMVAPPVAIGLDILIVVVALAILLWPLQRPSLDAPLAEQLPPRVAPPTSTDEHLVG